MLRPINFWRFPSIILIKLFCLPELQFHATLMNVRHRKRCFLFTKFNEILYLKNIRLDLWVFSIITFRSKRNRRNDSFDARHIFKVYGSKEWGEYLIREVHLSQRFKFDESGYYHCCSSISLPEDMQTEWSWPSVITYSGSLHLKFCIIDLDAHVIPTLLIWYWDMILIIVVCIKSLNKI